MQPMYQDETLVPPTTAPPASPELTDAELLELWQALRRATTTVDNRLNVAMLSLPLQPQAVEALCLLVNSTSGRLTMTRLATLLGVTSGGLTKLVDRLVDDGLVHRQHSTTDRRVIFAVLTDRGDEQFRRAMPVYGAQLRAEFGDIPSARLHGLRSVCRGFLVTKPVPAPAACPDPRVGPPETGRLRLEPNLREA